MGCFVAELGWCHDEANDLNKDSVRRKAGILFGAADYLGIEIDCAIWLLARRAPLHLSMPHCLGRKGLELMGLPVSARQRPLPCQAGQQTGPARCKVYLQPLAKRVSGYVENLAEFMIWHYIRQRFRHEIGAGRIHFRRVEFCQYGMPWRTPTLRMLRGGAAGRSFFWTCTGKGGLCSRTGLRHEPLSSIVPCNVSSLS